MNFAVGGTANELGGRDGHFHIVSGTLCDVGGICHSKPAGNSDAGAARQGLVARNSQRRCIVDRDDSDSVVYRCRFLAVGVAEVGKSGLQVQAAIAHTRTVVIRCAGEFEIVQRRLYVCQRTGEGDGIGVVAGSRCQAGRCTQDQVALRGRVGKHGVARIAVELDRGRDIAKTVGVG